MNIVNPKSQVKGIYSRSLSKSPYSVCVIGVFKDDSCSNVHLARGLESCPAVSRVMRFDYRECQKKSPQKLTRVMSRLPETCNLIIICKGSGIHPNIVKNMSKKATTFLWFMDWYPQIEWNKPILQFSRFCHYRSATGFDTSVLWADRLKLPVYHIVDGAATYLYYPEKKNKDFDVTFIGSHDVERECIVKYLTKKGFNVKFFGPGFTSYVDPTEFRDICNRSKIVLNISRSKYAGYSSLRLWNILSCGSMVITKEIPGIEKHLGLTPGENIDQFTTLIDLEEKLRYYLNRPNEIIKIGKNALNYVSKNRTWKHTAEEILKVIQEDPPKYVTI